MVKWLSGLWKIIKPGVIQFLQAAVAWALTYLVSHYGGAHFTIAGYGITVAAIIAFVESLATKYPVLKPWVGSI